MLKQNEYYQYLLTREDLKIVETSLFDKFFDVTHPLSKKYHTKKRKYALGLSKQSLNILGYAGIFFSKDNPIIHEPNNSVIYLTHYILSKNNDAIVGKVEFSRSWDGGEYKGTFNDGEILFSTIGQTSYLTLEDIEEKEDKDYFADVYLYPLNMMYLPLDQLSTSNQPTPTVEEEWKPLCEGCEEAQCWEQKICLWEEHITDDPLAKALEKWQNEAK